MRTIALIGCGAIARYVALHVEREPGLGLAAIIVSQEREADSVQGFGAGAAIVHGVGELEDEPQLVLDCAGHGALRQHGAAVLRKGIDLVTVSAGALADRSLHRDLSDAARDSGAQLRIASGAVGALDALSAARVGGLDTVTYRGRKPPVAWRGSLAEERLDLAALVTETTHFTGTAREAALAYPKNANVAASIALAGAGFEDTQVELIADPTITRNVHEIHAQGAFGQLELRIWGRALEDNPGSSALTAMSVVRCALDSTSSIVI